MLPETVSPIVKRLLLSMFVLCLALGCNSEDTVVDGGSRVLTCAGQVVDTRITRNKGLCSTQPVDGVVAVVTVPIELDAALRLGAGPKLGVTEAVLVLLIWPER